MITNEPRLCNKCYVFPCICGHQYDLLSSAQLNTLYKNLTNRINNTSSYNSLQEYLSAEEVTRMPKRFTKLLFEKYTATPLSTIWITLKNKNVLWKSCLLIMLTKYSKATVKNYYNFIVKLMTTYIVPGNENLSQILLAASTTDAINIPLVLSSASSIANDSSINKETKTYIANCVKLITYKKNESVLILLEALVGIISSISGVPNDVAVIDNNDINIEDLMIYIDEGISALIYEVFSDDFDTLKTTV